MLPIAVFVNHLSGQTCTRNHLDEIVGYTCYCLYHYLCSIFLVCVYEYIFNYSDPISHGNHTSLVLPHSCIHAYTHTRTQTGSWWLLSKYNWLQNVDYLLSIMISLELCVFFFFVFFVVFLTCNIRLFFPTYFNTLLHSFLGIQILSVLHFGLPF